MNVYIDSALQLMADIAVGFWFGFCNARAKYLHR